MLTVENSLVLHISNESCAVCRCVCMCVFHFHTMIFLLSSPGRQKISLALHWLIRLNKSYMKKKKTISMWKQSSHTLENNLGFWIFKRVCVKICQCLCTSCVLSEVNNRAVDLTLCLDHMSCHSRDTSIHGTLKRLYIPVLSCPRISKPQSAEQQPDDELTLNNI